MLKADKYHAHETRRMSRAALLALGGVVLVAVTLVLVFLVVGRTASVGQTAPPPRPITLSEAQRWGNCSEWSGAMESVKRVADGAGYLHNFEFDRLHPCCLLSNTNPQSASARPETASTHRPLSSNDVVFVVMTSAKTPLKAKGVLDTWGKGLENLLMISDAADPELPPGTITPAGAKAAAAKQQQSQPQTPPPPPPPATQAPAQPLAQPSPSPRRGATRGAAGGSGIGRAAPPPSPRAGDASGGGSGSGAGDDDAVANLETTTPASHAAAAAAAAAASANAASYSPMDEAHTPIWGVKYLSAAPEFANRMRSKKWFVIADDDTWINVPALLDFAGRYDARCPVVFGYVWSKIWSDREQVDYHSGGAGMLMSADAFWQIAPSFYTAACPFHHYNDITFGRCAWAKSVQLVHSRAFYYDPPERSKDRHETVWLPPVAEAITYHYVNPSDMHLMTQYVNQRWQYTPNPQRTAHPAFLAVSRADLKHTDWEALAKKHSP